MSTVARIALARTGPVAGYPALPDVGVVCDEGGRLRVVVASPGGPVTSALTLVPVASLTVAAQSFVVLELYLDGDAAPFAAWLAALDKLWTVPAFRIFIAGATPRAVALRAAWPSTHRRWAVGDVRPSTDLATGVTTPGDAPRGAPRLRLRLGLAAGDHEDAGATDADADAP